MAKTFDGPPTLERSGSEHRVGRFTSFLLRFLSPTRGTEGVVKTIEEGLVRGGAPFGKGDGGIRKIPSLMGKAMPVSAMKARFQIAECSSLYQQGRTG